MSYHVWERIQREGTLDYELYLDRRSYRLLRQEGVRTAGQLAQWTDAELLAIPGFGPACLGHVHKALAEWRTKGPHWLLLTLEVEADMKAEGYVWTRVPDAA